MERPVRMIVQFFKSLIEPIGWKEESFRVGHVNRHGDAKSSTGSPHRVETRIVNLDEWSRRHLLAQVESESLEHFEPARTGVFCVSNGVRLRLGIIRLIRSAPQRF